MMYDIVFTKIALEDIVLPKKQGDNVILKK